MWKHHHTGISCAAAFTLAAMGCELATSFDRSRIVDIDDVTDAAGTTPNPDAMADAASSVSYHDGSTFDAIRPLSVGHAITAQVAFIKPSNTTPGIRMNFGGSADDLADEPRPPAIALSADGSTLAVGAPGECSSGAGVNADQTQQADGGMGFGLLRGSGAVYVFVRAVDGSWKQQAFVKASDPSAQAGFGSNVQLSADGNTLMAGAAGVRRRQHVARW